MTVHGTEIVDPQSFKDIAGIKQVFEMPLRDPDHADERLSEEREL